MSRGLIAPSFLGDDETWRRFARSPGAKSRSSGRWRPMLRRSSSGAGGGLECFADFLIGFQVMRPLYVPLEWERDLDEIQQRRCQDRAKRNARQSRPLEAARPMLCGLQWSRCPKSGHRGLTGACFDGPGPAPRSWWAPYAGLDASLTAHATALLPVFLAAGSAVPDLPARPLALLLCYVIGRPWAPLSGLLSPGLRCLGVPWLLLLSARQFSR